MYLIPDKFCKKFPFQKPKYLDKNSNMLRNFPLNKVDKIVIRLIVVELLFDFLLILLRLKWLSGFKAPENGRFV